MALRKCPKCELNYLKPGETICHVCASAMKRKKPAPVEEEEVVMCSNCGEAPAVKGHDLCEECLRAQKREAELERLADQPRAEEAEKQLEEDIDDEDSEEE